MTSHEPAVPEHASSSSLEAAAPGPSTEAGPSSASSQSGSASGGRGMQLYSATETIEGVEAAMQMIVGDGCCFVWVGEAKSSPPMGSLCVATMTRYDSLPISSALLRDAAEDDLTQSLAHRLAKRTGLQVFASCGLPATPQHLPLLAALERRALEILSESN